VKRKTNLEIKLDINASFLEASPKLMEKTIRGMRPIMITQAPTDFLLIESMMKQLKTLLLKFLQCSLAALSASLPLRKC
jgi:hypothetical protein